MCYFALSFAQSNTQYDGDSWWNKTQISSEGNDFYVTFLNNWGKHVGATDLILTLYATSHYAAEVTVEGIYTDPVTKNSQPWTQTFNVPKDGVGTLVIPTQVAYLEMPNMDMDEEWKNKGLHVSTSAETPITLYTTNTNGNSYEAILVYPV